MLFLLLKRNIVDYIWKSANLEGIGVTYPETQVIYDNGIVNGLKVDDIIAINNLKYAWNFILENEDINYDYNVLCYIHKLVADKLVPSTVLGKKLELHQLILVVQHGNQHFQ
ncbi:MAG: hypothetical protein L6V81_03010 [Clostridium sp.]|nr:MAG: hypothetical protein L6V81_03010 [Clostridium sp.]